MEKIEGKVLLVDDEEQFLDALSQRLEARGLKVDAVTSGEDALSQVEDRNFDAIIVDLAMPGIDGIETLKLIKEKRPDLEIINWGRTTFLKNPLISTSCWKRSARQRTSECL